MTDDDTPRPRTADGLKALYGITGAAVFDDPLFQRLSEAERKYLRQLHAAETQSANDYTESLLEQASQERMAQARSEPLTTARRVRALVNVLLPIIAAALVIWFAFS
ncbi:hypothetical protein LVO79_21035 (plasmid) [Roseivivax marinus]|uniref:hypothetical protein n=1 Tax=Roseivivax marinus TaxID=1379903 RepID=UPI001F04CF19|nr:hypothetical protein [Roseivivax marinus]UMA67286.1 hypothetical protein LVO79_21035 [Roseivivax marinus]